MLHQMKLKPDPFRKICGGSKTIELRLYDEKRQKVKVGHRIEFTNLEDPESKILAEVKALHIYDSFRELFLALPTSAMGFQEEHPDPAVMEAYYSPEEQSLYGVVGIEILPISVPESEPKKRCKWCNLNNPLYVAYHDTEWGVLSSDDKYLYEMLILESFQAGLSWECVLNKREAFRTAYDGFDPSKVAAYGEEKIKELQENKAIIRHKQKIAASVKNSKIFMKIQQEHGSFYEYLKTFTGDRILYETGKTTNALSDTLSKDLQKRGMSFVGSVTMYSYLQAIGMIFSHDRECYLSPRLGLRWSDKL